MRSIAAFQPGSSTGQDLQADGKGQLMIVTGLEELRQRVIEKISLWRGELWTDERRGVPYHQELFKQPNSIGIATQLVTAEILGVEGGERIRGLSVTFDPESRKMFLQVTLESDMGSVQVDYAN